VAVRASAGAENRRAPDTVKLHFNGDVATCQP